MGGRVIERKPVQRRQGFMAEPRKLCNPTDIVPADFPSLETTARKSEAPKDLVWSVFRKTLRIWLLILVSRSANVCLLAYLRIFQRFVHHTIVHQRTRLAQSFLGCDNQNMSS